MFFLSLARKKKLLSKRSSCKWFETPWRSYNSTVMWNLWHSSLGKLLISKYCKPTNRPTEFCECHDVIVMAWDNIIVTIPGSKVHGAIMGPIWGRQDLGGPHVDPMDFAIWDIPKILPTRHQIHPGISIMLYLETGLVLTCVKWFSHFLVACDWIQQTFYSLLVKGLRRFA